MIDGTSWWQARSERVAWARSAQSPWRAWSFADNPDLCAVLDRAVRATPLAPDEAERRAELGVVPPPPPGMAHREAAWRRWAAEHAGELTADDTADAWRRSRLDALGHRVHRHERAAWAAATFSDDDAGDAEVSALWAGWFTGDPWSGREAWERLLLSDAMRAFRGVCEARRLPPDVRRRVVGDLREGFFWALLGAGGDSPPAWVELALRTLETAGSTPVDALALRLDEPGWGVVGRCVATRGSWADTIGRWQVERAEPMARARQVERVAAAQPALAEPLLDLHVVLRALAHLAATPSAPLWQVVRQNRGRARGRLRAVLAREPGRLMEPLLALPQLLDRSRAAVRRFAWSWAWRELATDFAFDPGRACPAPCLEPGEPTPPLAEGEVHALQSWVFLVALRGREAHLERWVRTGSTGDRDSTWARLLSEACPPCLVDDPQATGRSRTYHRLRTELCDQLPALRALLGPWLHQVGELPSGRGLRSAFEASFGSRWSSEVPFPKSGFPSFQRHAAELQGRWSTEQADPASIGDEASDASLGHEEAS